MHSYWHPSPGVSIKYIVVGRWGDFLKGVKMGGGFRTHMGYVVSHTNLKSISC